MKTYFILTHFILFCFYTFSSFGQTAFPDEIYEGGKQAFYGTIAKYMKYPKEAHTNGQFGTAVVGLQINPQGKLVKLEILNPLGFGIDEEIVRMFTKVITAWKAHPEKKYSYLILPITYTLEKNYTSFVKDVDKNQPDKVITPIVITGITKSIPPDYADIYESTKKTAYNSLEKKKLEKALSNFNKLIMINPFEKDFYIKRVEIEKELKLNTNHCQDIKTSKILFDLDLSNFGEDCSK